MIKLISYINDTISKSNYKCKASFNNEILKTKVICFSNMCSKEILEFSKKFNDIFNNKQSTSKILTAYILEDNTLFEYSLEKLNDKNLIQTEAIKNFNNATSTTSIAKCTKDKRFYIIKCYEYYIYIFDKQENNCYMLILNNKKTITMVNILILAPYLLYGELFAVHGGVVNKNNQNILINNSSLGGKTTFALLFASHGWNIITEETTYITKNGNILPYNIRNYFNIRVGTYVAFKDFFLDKKIINEEFISMQNKKSDELFDYGKQFQFSIDFDLIGKKTKVKNLFISHSLKVSINKNQKLEIKKCSSLENVNAFLELSLAPTVLLFQELLEYSNIDKKKRRNILNSIFKNTHSFLLKSGFDYKNKYDYIISKININL